MIRRLVASRAWLGISAISALAASLYWALVATVHEEERYGVAPGVYEEGPAATSFHSERDMTLIQAEGAGVLIILAVPVILALLPLVFGRRGVTGTCGGVLLVLAFLGSASIGLLYLPAALALLGAAVVTPSDVPTRPERPASFPAPHLSENPSR